MLCHASQLRYCGLMAAILGCCTLCDASLSPVKDTRPGRDGVGSTSRGRDEGSGHSTRKTSEGINDGGGGPRNTLVGLATTGTAMGNSGLFSRQSVMVDHGLQISPSTVLDSVDISETRSTSESAQQYASAVSEVTEESSPYEESFSKMYPEYIRSTGPEIYRLTGIEIVPPPYIPQPDFAIGSFYNHSDHALCPLNTFSFGSSCRNCTSTVCAVGQYRVSCNPYHDSFCTSCTNKPNNIETRYTEPGTKSLGCKWETCGSLCPSTHDSSMVILAFWIEVPIRLSEFEDIKAQFLRTLSAAGGVDSSLVKVVRVDEVTIDSGRSSNEGSDLRRTAQGSGRKILAQAFSCCSREIPQHNQSVHVLSEVIVPVVSLKQTWTVNFSQYNLALQFVSTCLPPPQVRYRMPDYLAPPKSIDSPSSNTQKTPKDDQDTPKLVKERSWLESDAVGILILIMLSGIALCATCCLLSALIKHRCGNEELTELSVLEKEEPPKSEGIRKHSIIKVTPITDTQQQSCKADWADLLPRSHLQGPDVRTSQTPGSRRASTRRGSNDMVPSPQASTKVVMEPSGGVSGHLKPGDMARLSRWKSSPDVLVVPENHQFRKGKTVQSSRRASMSDTEGQRYVSRVQQHNLAPKGLDPVVTVPNEN